MNLTIRDNMIRLESQEDIVRSCRVFKITIPDYGMVAASLSESDRRFLDIAIRQENISGQLFALSVMAMAIERTLAEQNV